jgi:hypothetical protein
MYILAASGACRKRYRKSQLTRPCVRDAGAVSQKWNREPGWPLKEAVLMLDVSSMIPNSEPVDEAGCQAYCRITVGCNGYDFCGNLAGCGGYCISHNSLNPGGNTHTANLRSRRTACSHGFLNQ